MRILVSSPIYPPDIGGPALYAQRLASEFEASGHEVRVVTYKAEKRLPMGVRHLAYFAKALPSVRWAERILVLDTFSAGVPTAAAALLLRKPFTLRIGGDFLWEMHVERTRAPLPLPDFYAEGFESKLSRKETVIFKLTRFVLSKASVAAFTTPWLRDIWSPAYGIDGAKCKTVENVIEPRLEYREPAGKRFLWAGRDIFLKNAAAFKRAFDAAKKERPEIELDMVQVSRKELEKKLDACYAAAISSLSEVSPNFAVEAMRHGKPFLLTKHNGLAEDVRELAVLVDPLSFEGLKASILAVADDAEHARLRERIRSFARVRPWKQVAGEFLALLESNKLP